MDVTCGIELCTGTILARPYTKFSSLGHHTEINFLTGEQRHFAVKLVLKDATKDGTFHTDNTDKRYLGFFES